MKGKTAPLIGLILVCALVFGGIYLTRNIGKSDRAIDKESAQKKLERMVSEVEPESASPVKSAVEYTNSEDDGSELPDISESPIAARASTSLFAEIFSSPEKAGSGSDGWLREMAEAFNRSGAQVGGRDVSVQIRNITSGLALDYIRTKKAVPDGFTPSNMMWVSMLEAKGIATEVIAERMVGNTAVMVLKNDKYKEFVQKYGSMDLKSVVEATEAGEFVMGYTNPFTSSTGLNFLVSTLQRFDANNMLSDKAASGFEKFQSNVPFVSLNTVQMRDAAEKGTLDGFILEYQLYTNDKNLSKNYTATPFGYRHDNPLVAIASTDSDKKEILRQFAEFCQSSSAKALADKYGFNQLDNYISEAEEPDGDTLIQAQKLYKQSKDAGKSVIGVFVADVSGSMDGAPINSLKRSLINSIQYISPSNYIGLVSYSNGVTIEVPIDQFGIEQQSYFKGGVENMYASGATATYDAVCVALDMIEKAMEQHPDAKPILFVLSDGETNRGYSLNDIEEVVSALQIPIYTINYNNGASESLQALSNINEAASIDASSEDVVYQLKNLLNASM